MAALTASPLSACESDSQGATNRQGQLARQSAFGTDLSITLAGPETAAVGDRVELTVTITNHGPKVPPGCFDRHRANVAPNIPDELSE